MSAFTERSRHSLTQIIDPYPGSGSRTGSTPNVTRDFLVAMNIQPEIFTEIRQPTLKYSAHTDASPILQHFVGMWK